MTEKLYYFAYGSNLLMEQMVQRCPQSLPFTQGLLRDHKLVYKSNPSGRGVADVIPSKGDKVYGAIYEVTREDLKKLDRYEGRPTVYERYSIEVETRKGMINCIAYFMQPQYLLRLPNVDYFKKIFQGYGDWALPQKHLTDSYALFKKEANILPPAKLNVTNSIVKNNNKSSKLSKSSKGGSKNQGKNQSSKKNKASGVNGGKPLYKTQTPIGYEPAIRWT